ncbi:MULTISPECIES: conjugative transfer protein MobI(A/C) [unclassified Ketobacter]|uniref:conjugative transfer protein MobI(A/C) n=1 Tax=unclassified Ketobacter TaxID=2639109 RepID=UPI000F0F7F2F|nr:MULTISPECIES: conjugative transfer protein MobI(A/C) [unclassified Ketobacter]RLT87700.1 MAG: hypothetical protein D9N13_21735 [Ketobacter sp. GenoA1]RLT96635.1 MAG: hypothetical protein D9N15_11030 [Ketobacter sp.]
MSNEFFDVGNPSSICAIAEDIVDARQGLSDFMVRKASFETLCSVLTLLESVHSLAYLEGKIHCDNYHEGKRSFKDLGESYGYLNTFVRQEQGSNTFRFGYRRPTGQGSIIRENIRPAKEGYTENNFKRAAHDYEKELAMMTEEHYRRLRKGSRIVRKAMRLLKGHPLLLECKGLEVLGE